MAGLLSGVTVLEVANEFGEWTGRLLADQGARVIKIEPPGGNATRKIGPFHRDEPNPERSIHFWHYNAGKESITLDLLSEKGRDLFRQLAKRADVIIETLSPGQMDDWGLGYQSLSKLNPGLVFASITPFGQTGPHRDWNATDMTLLAMGGPMNSSGYDEPEPYPVCPAGGQSYHTGGHYAMVGIMLALIQRKWSGRGQHVDVAIQACLAVTTEGAAVNWLYLHELVHRHMGRHASVKPTPCSIYLCADGHYVLLHSTRDEKPWRELVKWLTEEGLVDDLADEQYSDMRYRADHADHVMEVMSKLCDRYSAMELFQRGQAMGLANAIVRRPEEWLDDPHTNARQLFVPVEYPEVGQTVRYARSPYLYSDAEATVRRRAPHLGENSNSVYAQLGLTSRDLAQLRAEGTI